MDWSDLGAYVGAGLDDNAFVEQCWTEAQSMVSAFIGAAVVPQVVVDRATLEVGSELYHRRQAPNGMAQFATLEGTAPVRIARDPMVGAYPILRRWVVVF